METTFDYLRQFGPLLAERILETYPPLQSTKDPVAPGLTGLLRLLGRGRQRRRTLIETLEHRANVLLRVSYGLLVAAGNLFILGTDLHQRIADELRADYFPRAEDL